MSASDVLQPIDMSTLPNYVSTSPGPNSFVGTFGNWLTDNAGWLGGIGGAAGQAYSIDRALAEANRIAGLGSYLNEFANTQGSYLNDASTFKGYGITGTGLGPTTGSVDDDGAFNLSFGVLPSATMANQGQAQRTAGGTAMNEAGARLRDAKNMINGVNYMDASNAAITQSLAPSVHREKEIYDRLMAMQNPELNRQQMAQQAQEYAMGRGGVRGTQYGGTAEDAAMARARADVANKAAVDAITLAREDQGMLGQLGANYGNLYNQQTNNMANVAKLYQDRGMDRYNLGLKMEELKYLPQKMQLEIMNQMMAGVDATQTGQLTGLGYLSDMMLGGMSTNVNSQKVAAELRSNLYNALLSNLGGATGSDGSSTSGLGGLLSAVGGGIQWLDDTFF